MKPCLTPRCPNLTDGTYCAPCGGSQADTRPGPRERGYDGDWDRLRAQVLEEEPSCRLCSSTDDPHVDHIVSIRKGGGRLDRANLQRLCGRCHRSKTNREDGGFGNPVKGAA